MAGEKSANVPQWLEDCLETASSIVNDPTPVTVSGRLSLGIDLGTSDVVSMVLDENRMPVAVCLEWADVVRDGVVFNYFGATNIVRKQLAAIQEKTGIAFTEANTSYPPGTDPRISVNVLESAGLSVAAVIDEPSAVAHLLELDKAAVVDIGGGTTGIAVLRNRKVVYSGDEPTGGHHVTLTIAGNNGSSLEEAEELKRSDGTAVWPIVKPVFEKMADIARLHLKGHKVKTLFLSGGTCMLPGVRDLFQQEFSDYAVALPNNSIFLTPLAIAAYRD